MDASDDPLEAKREALFEIAKQVLTPANMDLAQSPEGRRRVHQEIMERIGPLLDPPDPHATPVEAPKPRG